VTEPDTRNTVADLVPTQDVAQKYILVADGSNNEVRILVRETGEVIGTFGRSGRMAGDFHSIHNIAIDSQGNVYTAEADTAKRAQKFQQIR
jgi:DNA-binding beta-propeller fold protein YncE